MSTVTTCPHCLSSLDGVSLPNTPIHPPSPAAESLANSNEPPLDSFNDYENNLAQTQTRLKLVVAEIARMEKSLRVLQEERDCLNGFVVTYKRILQPIRRLPDNILREVFRLSTDDGSLDMELFPGPKRVKAESDSLSPNQMPWKLGQISHHWCEVALAYPSLWSFIRIQFPDHSSSQQLLAGMSAQLVRQLRRSRSSMLTISLHNKPAHSLHENDPFLTAISPHSSRWVALRADLTPQDLCVLGNLIRGEVQNLRKLYLHNPGPVYQPTELEGINAFQIAPCLHDITISAQRGLDRLPIPWSQITTLRTSADGSSESFPRLSHLQYTPNLEAFFIFVLTLGINTPVAAVLPSLRILSVQCNSSNSRDVEYLLEHFGSVRLRELRINAEALTSFLIRVPSTLGNALRSLCLRVDGFSSSDAVMVFSSLPVLESLSLCNMQSGVLSDLAARDSTGRLQFLPRLLDVGFYATKAATCDDSALLQVLDNRFRRNSSSKSPTDRDELQLQKVRIHRNISLQESTLRQLEILVSEGLQVDTSPVDWIHFFPGF
ncbi:hypothetical protein V5O48_011471 [Marasmius crinis-equi]|uniref:F-box domain-containing protein n=1 Tax=Marasmius crinis-equi TaxID=585013 RepID=A0ABR3F5G8_9AGAR